MNLKNTDLCAITLLNDTQVCQSSINTALQRLVENDIQLANPNGAAPKIWECKWYNDDTIAGYPKGYAVWYNTEPPEQFIQFHANRIYSYAKNNTYLKNKIKPYSLNEYDMYYSILTGYYVAGMAAPLQPLFDIGNIVDNVQIKISLVDNNKHVPSDSKYWKDFIIRDNYAGVNSIVSSMLSSLMAKHLEDYHFGNDGFAENISNYLLKDLSNIKNLQHYNSHDLTADMEGFDYVKKFVKVPVYEKYSYSVVQTEADMTRWQVKDYEAITKNGKISDTAKSEYITKLGGCANYVSANIEGIIYELEDKAIVGITYDGINSSVVPKSTTDYSLISSRLDKYNCSFDIVPLTAFDMNELSVNGKYYVNTVQHIVDYYPYAQYTYNNWFRLWSSGKLEYGGVVPVGMNGNINVKFGWKYTENGKQQTAPVYDYPTTVKSFYGPYNQFSKDIAAAYDAEMNLKADNRYIVQLTPVYARLDSHLSSDPIEYKYDEQFFDYASNEANTFKNDGFSIFIDDSSSAKYYQYYVTGFITGN